MKLEVSYRAKPRQVVPEFFVKSPIIIIIIIIIIILIKFALFIEKCLYYLSIVDLR